MGSTLSLRSVELSVFLLSGHLKSPPSAAVVEPSDVAEDIGLGLGPGPVNTTMDTFAFEHAEEAFHRGVVGAAGDGTHALDEVVAFQEPLVLAARELAAMVGVQDDRSAG